MPKISIIVPVYNAARYVRKCLDSILTSDMDDIEIIAVNDGSTDNSLELLERYHAKYDIKVISQANSGPAKARNAGLEAATGEYIGFVDSDDWVEPCMFSKMYQAAKTEDADIVFCNVFRNENRKIRKYMPSGVYDINNIEKTIYPILISNLDETSSKSTLRGCVWLRIFKKELLNRNGIKFEEGLIYNEDGLFCIEATLVCQRYVYLGDSYLYHNRYVPTSLTKRYVKDLWFKQRKMIHMLYETTKGCKYDFTLQINKKAMEIAIYCVENICKKDSGKSLKEKISAIRDIITSEEISGAVNLIPKDRLKRINKLYLLSFILKSPLLAMITAKYRMKRNRIYS